MENVIEVKALRRDYMKRRGLLKCKKSIVKAVDGIDFEVKRGEVFGLLGENGAGKTTTIKMLITMLAPTSGTCKVLGFNTFGEEKKIRSRINFIFGGELGVYRRLSARDNLQYFANLYHMPRQAAKERIAQALALVGLSDKADVLVETYSKGMVQRLQIARGLMNDAEILFMDEPTIGLDPLGARALRDLILSLKERGKTVLLTTHYMYEADELCDRIAIINKGKIVALDTPEGLKNRLEPLRTLEVTAKRGDTTYVTQIEAVPGVRSVTLHRGENDVYVIKHKKEQMIGADVLKVIHDVLSLTQKDVTLEDAFISLVEEKK